jgi:hypothetical protein
MLRDWRDQGAISRRAKTSALCALGISYAFSTWLTQSTAVALGLAAVMGAVAVYVVTRPDPSRGTSLHAEDRVTSSARRASWALPKWPPSKPRSQPGKAKVGLRRKSQESR